MTRACACSMVHATSRERISTHSRTTHSRWDSVQHIKHAIGSHASACCLAQRPWPSLHARASRRLCTGGQMASKRQPWVSGLTLHPPPTRCNSPRPRGQSMADSGWAMQGCSGTCAMRRGGPARMHVRRRDLAIARPDNRFHPLPRTCQPPPYPALAPPPEEWLHHASAAPT